MVQALAAGYPLMFWRLTASINPLGQMGNGLLRVGYMFEVIISD